MGVATTSADRLRIGGLTPLTSLDYPGELAAVVYCRGCPWRCPYCHNADLQDAAGPAALGWRDIVTFLEGRRGLLDAVVLSGGEPTAQQALPAALAEIRAARIQDRPAHRRPVSGPARSPAAAAGLGRPRHQGPARGLPPHHRRARLRRARVAEPAPAARRAHRFGGPHHPDARPRRHGLSDATLCAPHQRRCRTLCAATVPHRRTFARDARTTPDRHRRGGTRRRPQGVSGVYVAGGVSI
jgi:hypothetical protein